MLNEGGNVINNVYKDMFEEYNLEIRNSFTPVYSQSEPIKNLFNYFLMNIYSANRLKRIKYDGDARYFYSHENQFNEKKEREKYAIRGDTMISFFSPYKYAIKIETGIIYGRDGNCIESLLNKINEDKYREVNERFERFIELYHTRGNFILLPLPKPDGRMNTNRYICSEDKIDRSLYQCFPGGKLSKYFNNDIENLREWIIEEKLTSLFKDEVIARENIIVLNKKNPFINYSRMSKEELYEFIDNSVKLIEFRNSEFGTSIN